MSILGSFRFFAHLGELDYYIVVSTSVFVNITTEALDPILTETGAFITTG